MAEIKSALEIAMEKADRLGRASREEIEQEQTYDNGRKLAARYLRGETGDLKSEIGQFPGQSIQTVLKGAIDTLLRNVVLPRDKFQWDNIKMALKGLEDLKGSVAKQVTAQVVQLLEHYKQTKNQYREQVSARFQAQLGGIQQAMASQYGAAAASGIDVEALPEFQQEWAKITEEIDSQFERQLSQLKQYLEQM